MICVRSMTFYFVLINLFFSDLKEEKQEIKGTEKSREDPRRAWTSRGEKRGGEKRRAEQQSRAEEELCCGQRYVYTYTINRMDVMIKLLVSSVYHVQFWIFSVVRWSFLSSLYLKLVWLRMCMYASSVIPFIAVR